MNKLVTKFAPFLTRVFKTNWLTTGGGLIILLGIVLHVLHLVEKDFAVEVMGSGGVLVGIGAKDGTRDHPTVAPESLDAPDVAGGSPPLPPTGAALVLLFFSGLLLSAAGCASQLNKPVAALPAQYLVSDRLHVTPFSPALPVVHRAPAARPLGPVAADTLGPVPFYLAPPPADLSKRQLRQYRRAQLRAGIEASRTVPVKVKQGSSSAYAPAGTAVALTKPTGPTAVGQDNAATDNTKAGQHANGGVGSGSDVHGPIAGASSPPKPPDSWLARTWHSLWSKIWEYGLVALALVVIGLLVAVRFSPLGRGLRAAAAAARASL